MATSKDDRLKALDTAMGQIEKQHGKGTIMKLGGNPYNEIDAISTGSIMVDYALVLMEFQEGVSQKFMAPRPVVKPRLPCR